MICAYLDDAGNTGKKLDDPNQPLHIVCALLVPEVQWQAVKDAISHVKEKAIEWGYDPTEACELHGVEILQGSKGWKQVPLAQRLQLLGLCVDILDQHEIPHVMGACDKPKLAKRYFHPAHPHSLASWLCLERVARYANERGENVVLVADNCIESIKQVAINSLKGYRRDGAPFGPTVDFSRLIDTLHHMDSHDSPHIQLCDILLYIRYRWVNKRDERLKELSSRIKARRYYETGIIPY